MCIVLEQAVDSDLIDMHAGNNTMKFAITSHLRIKNGEVIFKSVSYSLNLLETLHVVAINDSTGSKNSSARKNFTFHT
jgi:hypothetical protein